MNPEHRKELETIRRRLVRVLGNFYGSIKFNLNPKVEADPTVSSSNCNVGTELDGIEVMESVNLRKKNEL